MHYVIDYAGDVQELKGRRIHEFFIVDQFGKTGYEIQLGYTVYRVSTDKLDRIDSVIPSYVMNDHVRDLI